MYMGHVLSLQMIDLFLCPYILVGKRLLLQALSMFSVIYVLERTKEPHIHR
jgi:hypothetical protein